MAFVPLAGLFFFSPGPAQNGTADFRAIDLFDNWNQGWSATTETTSLVYCYHSWTVASYFNAVTISIWASNFWRRQSTEYDARIRDPEPILECTL